MHWLGIHDKHQSFFYLEIAIDMIASQYQNMTLWRPINCIKHFAKLIVTAMDISYYCNLLAYAILS